MSRIPIQKGSYESKELKMFYETNQDIKTLFTDYYMIGNMIVGQKKFLKTKGLPGIHIAVVRRIPTWIDSDMIYSFSSDVIYTSIGKHKSEISEITIENGAVRLSDYGIGTYESLKNITPQVSNILLDRDMIMGLYAKCSNKQSLQEEDILSILDNNPYDVGPIRLAKGLLPGLKKTHGVSIGFVNENGSTMAVIAIHRNTCTSYHMYYVAI